MPRHSVLTGSALHEPKDISTASANEVYVADGAGSGDWGDVTSTMLGLSGGEAGDVVVSNGANGFAYRNLPHGQVHFEDLAAPATVYTVALSAGAANAVKLAPTTTAGGSGTNVTEGTNARLTYIGTPMVHFHIAASLSFDQASGADRDIVIELWKNGTTKLAGSMLVTTNTANRESTAVHSDVMLSTNDYIEMYAYTVASAATMRLNSFYIFMMGMFKG